MGRLWEGSRQEWSSTHTPSPSHPIPARFFSFLTAQSPQSLAQISPCPGAGALSFPQAWGQDGRLTQQPGLRFCAVFLCVPEKGDREENGHHHVPSSPACRYQGTGPNQPCCRKAGLALAHPVFLHLLGPGTRLMASEV